MKPQSSSNVIVIRSRDTKLSCITASDLLVANQTTKRRCQPSCTGLLQMRASAENIVVVHVYWERPSIALIPPAAARAQHILHW